MYEYTTEDDEPTHQQYLNAKPYDAPVRKPSRVGSTEVWYVINLTEDNQPAFILGLFLVLDQTALVKPEEFTECLTKKNDAVKCHL